MNKKKPAISKEEFRQNFHYEPTTGKMFRKHTRVSGKVELVSVGHPNISSGHYRIIYKQRPFYFHRLAWMLVNGDWPKGAIDHINRDSSDNRLCNLRLAGRSGNQWNRGATISDDFKFFSKYKGVGRNCGKWIARLQYTEPNGERHHLWLGRFHTEEEAALAYNKAAKKYHGEFAYLNEVK